ncbi:GSCOCT00010306001.2-RA-CDS [Cotesia congregata]|uniref:Cc_odve66_32 n=1 Tax=Cotesia congregata TaxID=51543 RepID=A0A8J2ECL2_COTCN|nr:GSCOCT00010306001.2-RA-CDS [Cotesia congregata]CAG5074867.1 Cc_odve66_32 [Cotesia congregata]
MPKILSTLLVILVPLLIFAAIYFYPLLEITSPEDENPALDDPNLRTQFTREDAETFDDISIAEVPKLPTKDVPKPVRISKPRDSRTRILFNAFTLKLELPQKDKTLASAYVTNPTEKFNNNFVTEGVPKIGAIATYGINLLSGYFKEGTADYLIVVEDLIKRVNVALEDKTLIAKQHWYDVAVMLTRLLATYKILGTNDKVKNICHERICKITTKFNFSLGVTRRGVELVWVAVPWIVTNHLSNNLSGLQVTPHEFQDLQKFINGVDRVPRGEISDGLHQECSFIYKQVTTYWPLVETGEFYFGVCRAREYDVGLEDVIKGIFNDVLHPNMNFVPLGLFGRAPKVTCDDLAREWPNYTRKAEFKVRIWPISGLGVFKSEKFAFWLRVQRNHIVAYESDYENFEYAAGWIQMRKLYQVAQKDKYKTTLTRKELRDQPGVISYADEKDADFERFKPVEGKFVKAHDATVLKSHIGHFIDKRVLYWWNKYQFEFYGSNTVIDECGVCTDNGLVVSLEVTNKSGRTLRVRTKDENCGDMIFKCKVNGVENLDGIVNVDDNKVAVIDWRQEFEDQGKNSKVTVNGDLNSNMTFYIGNDIYSMFVDGDNHFITTGLLGETILYYSSTMKNVSSSLQPIDVNYNFVLDTETYLYKRTN